MIFDDIYENIGLPIYIVRQDTQNVVFINQKCKALFGDIVGKSCFEVLNGTVSPCDGCTYTHLDETNCSANSKSRYLSKINKYVDTYANLIKLPDGTNGRICVVIDVSEREFAKQKNAVEDALRKKMQHKIDIQHGFIQSARSMMSATTLDARMLFANKAFCESLGYTEDEVLKMKVKDFHPPEIAKNFKQKYIPSALKEGYWKGDTELFKKDGTVLPVRQIIFPILSDDGETIAVAAIMDDITKELELERMNRYQLAIMDCSTNYIGVSDLNGKSMYHSPGAYRMLGYEPGEVEEWDKTVAHPKWYLDRVLNEGIPTAMKNSQWVGRGELFDRYGKCIPIEQTIFPVFDSEKRPMGVATIIQDISEKLVQEEKIESARRTLRTIIDTAPSAIYWKDKNSRYLGANKQFAIDVGLNDPNLVIGMTDYDLFPKDIADAYVAEEMKVWETEEDFFYAEKKFHGREGTVGWISSSKVLMRNAKGESSELLGMYDDITKQKKNEAKLSEAIKAAEEASNAKSEFLSRMSHEIRTPMNAILGMTKIGLGADGTERMLYCLDKIESASKHLLGLINDILDMSKIEANMLQIVEESFVVAKMVDAIRNVVALRAEEKKQNFAINVMDAVPSQIIADEMRISQVITNLLSNAVKFTPERGTVSMNVGYVRDNIEDVSEDTVEKGRLIVTVTDNGTGITEEQQAKLFRPFEQADAATSRKYGGTGLGLAISKRFIEMMSGKLTVVSRQGEGSTFAFVVPVTKDTSQKPADESAKERDEGIEGIFGGVNVLLAEDIDINREIVLSLLEETGVQIDCAVNGEIAVKMFNQSPEKYNLIIMDIQMPIMDGIEATRKIRASAPANAKTIPIIAMTANAFAEDVKNCKDAGMNDHIRKPLDLDILIEKMKHYLKQ